MNKESLKNILKLISSSLVVSGNMMLSACDGNEQQKQSKKLSQVPVPVASKPQYIKRESNEVLQASVIAKKVVVPKAKTKIEDYKQSRGAGSTQSSTESLIIEEEKQPEFIILDLSLNLDIEEKYYNLGGVNRKNFQGIFNFDEDELNFEMETYFEWPHNENREQDIAPDGAGVGIKVGI